MGSKSKYNLSSTVDQLRFNRFSPLSRDKITFFIHKAISNTQFL